MAGIDDRARGLNERLARDDDEDEQTPVDDEDQGDEGGDVDDDEDQADDEEDAGPQPGPRTQAAREGGPALSAGLVLGLIAYSMAIQVFKGGPSQLGGWIKAKLINEPWGPAAAAGGG